MIISKYCSNCGKPIFAEDKFCGSCGDKINYSFSEENAESVGNNPPITEKEPFAKTNSANAQYYSVSPEKLAILSIITLNLYPLYWFYKNWLVAKEKEKLNVSPFWRAFFAPLFADSLFKIILTASQKQGYKGNYSPLFLAIVFIIFYIAWKFSDSWGIIYFLVFIPLLPVQKAIDFINSKNNPNLNR